MSAAARAAVEQLEGRQLLSASAFETHLVKWDGHRVEAIRDRYVVQTKNRADFAAFAARKGLDVTDVKSLGGGFFGFSSSAGAAKVNRWATRFKADLRALTPSVIFRARAESNDPHRGQQWAHNNVAQQVPTLKIPFDPVTGQPVGGGYDNQIGRASRDVDAHAAWDITTGYSDTDGNDNNDIVIAVIDSGIDTTHPDLVANLYTNPNEVAGDGVDNDGNGVIDDVHGFNAHGVYSVGLPSLAGDVTDEGGHGTHVSGIIGAVGNNGIGVAGMAWNVKILPVKVLGGPSGTGSVEGIIAGIQYVTAMKRAGVNVVAFNASLGIDPDVSYPFDELWFRAIDQAGEADILAIIAAGNETTNNDAESVYPARFSLTNPNVVTVASTDNQDLLSTFSNIGLESVLVAAPGDGILSTVPTYLSDSGTTPLDPTDPMGVPYGYASGTSMAAPQVAGIVALMASARPGASMADLKQALVDSVEKLDHLDRPYGLGFTVSTGGRVNAYRAVRAIQNRHADDNAGTGGSWRGKYGSEGVWLPGGDTARVPAYATVSRAKGGRTRAVPSSARDEVRLDNPGRSGKYSRYVSAMGETTFDINLTDGQTHRVSFYVADLGPRGRDVRFTVRDAASGAAIATHHASELSGGKYASFDLTGHVLVDLAAAGGAREAALLGIFFDPAPTTPKAMVNSDRETSGDWQERYGADGAFLVGKDPSFPDQTNVVGSITGGRRQTLATFRRTVNGAGLQREDTTDRRVAGFYKGMSMIVDLNFTDAADHNVTLYAADLDKRNRTQRYELIDPGTGEVLDRRTISDFNRGQYVTWTVSGHKQVRVTRLAGPDAVVNGVFFDHPSGTNAHFVGLDNTTSGAWQREYGWSGAWIVGETDNLPPDALNPATPAGTTISVADGTTRRVLDPRSGDSAALRQRDGTGARIEGQYESRTSFDVDLNVTGPVSQRVSFYAADYDRRGFMQRIDMFDAASGKKLATVYMKDLSEGQYATFDVLGHVRVQFTNMTENDGRAVLSGVFFG
ncbi:MAG TPA: S8 family peptidase [Tepidisphaeraceae bacterium]|nr:S8 family peptidase [Tepidisphaeraceae bacterium]